MITIASIQKAVAREYSVPVAFLKEPYPRGKCGVNTRKVSRPRQVAMALSALLTEQSYQRIGHWFGGRDHTTVMFACREIARRRRSEPKLHNAMCRISFELCQPHHFHKCETWPLVASQPAGA